LSELKIAQRKRRKNNFWRCANFVGTKFGGGGKARVGREFLPRRVAKRLLRGIFPTPLFLPAPPERELSKVGVGPRKSVETISKARVLNRFIKDSKKIVGGAIFGFQPLTSRAVSNNIETRYKLTFKKRNDD